jgi:hypothetical protein
MFFPCKELSFTPLFSHLVLDLGCPLFGNFFRLMGSLLLPVKKRRAAPGIALPLTQSSETQLHFPTKAAGLSLSVSPLLGLKATLVETFWGTGG